MATISIGTLRYDIVSDTTSFVKGIKATRQQKKEADRVFREGLTPMQRHNLALLRMMELYKKGMITKKQVLAQQVKIKATLRQEQQALRMAGMKVEEYRGSYARASRGLAAFTANLNANTRAILRNRAAGGMGGGGGGGPMRGAANGNRWANFGGSLGSALGFGGAGAGAGRIAGMGSATMLGIGAGALLMKKMIDEARELETALVDMQVIMGDDRAGEALVNNLREIARETPLTSKALIKGAQTLLGYGLSAEGLEDTMYRIGEIAGGDAQRMDSLTRAFAQVQSAGKLMGQEMLQLVNAGFPVAEIAKAAGVSMEDFRKEMEAGNIKASHLTEAMINLTEAGGLMEGRLARQADTINGKWITAMGSIDQAFAEMGQGGSSVAKDMIQSWGEFVVSFLGGIDDISDAVNEFSSSLGLDMGLSDALDNSGKELSTFGKSKRYFTDLTLKWWYGYEQAEIDAMRASDRKVKKMDDTAKKGVADMEKHLEGRKKIKESIDNEVKQYEEAQKAKAKAIYDEMKPEEDLAAMRQRHWEERNKARKEGTRLRAGSGNAAADKYLKATMERQKAEEAKMIKKMQEERLKSWKVGAKDAEDKRFDLEKKNIKKAAELRKKKIQDQYDFQQAIAASYGMRGQAASTDDSYAAAAAIQAEYEQNSLENKANEKREQQLDDLKKLQMEAERKAQMRHEQRMAQIDARTTGNVGGTP